MGRGRQKAKNTKIARELKYDTYNVDLTALQRELGHPDDDVYVDKWAKDLDDDEEEDHSQPSYERA